MPLTNNLSEIIESLSRRPHTTALLVEVQENTTDALQWANWLADGNNCHTQENRLAAIRAQRNYRMWADLRARLEAIPSIVNF